MGEPLLILVPTGAVILIAVFGWLDAPRVAQNRLAKLATTVGLEPGDDVAALVERRLRRRQRAMMIGMVTGAALGTLPAFTTGAFAPTLAWWMAGELLGTGAGGLVVHVADCRAATRPGQRAAVLRPRRLHDFLYPAETVAPLVALLLPALVVALVLTSTGPAALAPGLLAGAVVAVAVTIGTVVAQRYVLRMAPPADSPTRVKWEDAMRSIALRDLGVIAFSVCLALGGVAAFQAANDLLVGYPDVLFVTTLVCTLLGVAVLIVLTVLTERSGASAQRFLRLYQDTAPGSHR